MHGFAAVLVALVFLAVPFGIAGVASALPWEERDLTPVVISGERTDRLDGGALVGVRAGETVFGVRYGTVEHPNNLVIFAEYKRYLGAADIVDASGELLRTRGLPVHTVVGQSLDAFVEFEDRDANGLLNFRTLENGTVVPVDVPVKGMRLFVGWQLDGPVVEAAGDVTYVNFTLSATSVPYGALRNGTRTPTPPEVGTLDRVAFTFHLEVAVVEKEALVPWYRITVDTATGRDVVGVERLEPRNVSGAAVEMRAKYDHRIEGWDFAAGANLLALETHMLLGNHIPTTVARIVHAAYYHERAETDDGSYRHDPNVTDPAEPVRITWDQIVFADEWTRVGRFQWASNVTVDGRDATMTFQVQGGDRFLGYRHDVIFEGFRIRGAFIYPNGATIVHDPAIAAESLLPDLGGSVNVTPLTILAVQLGLVAIAVGPALYLRAKAKARRQA